MSRRDNGSSDHTRWTNEKLLNELERYVGLKDFGSYFRDNPVSFGTQQESGDFIREETRIYRDTWIVPLIEELRQRVT